MLFRSADRIEIEDVLVEPAPQDIFYLDAIGSGLWRLLAAPQALAQLQEVVREAFPEQPAAAVDADVAAALDELVARRLVLADP